MSTFTAWVETPPAALARSARGSWFRAALLSATLALALALAQALSLGRLPLNLYDVSFTLDWGRELIHGQLPDVRVSGAVTPHPLSILAGAFASLLGGGALDAIRGVVFISCGAVCVALLAIGRACRLPLIGVIAALVLMLSEPFVDATLGQATASDLPSLAAVLGALALELARPRRGIGPLLLLALAGLWRPEAWLLSILYWLYVVKGRDRASQLKLAALALSAPVLWAITDLLLTGNVLYSLTYTREAAALVGRPRGLANVPTALESVLSSNFSTPVLVGGALGIGLDLWFRQLPRMLCVALVLTILAFAAVGTANLPLNERYALPTTVLIVVYFGFFLVGWRRHPVGRFRSAWMLSALAIAGLALVPAPAKLKAIARDRHALSAQAGIESQLDSLLKPSSVRGVIKRCAPLQASWRIVPILAYEVSRSPSAIVTVNAGVPTGGTVVEPSSALAAQQFEAHADPASAFLQRGYRVLASNASWLVYTSCA